MLRSPLWFSILVGITLVCLGSLNVDADPDLFHRLAMGKILSEERVFPFTDPFAFTPKLPKWIDHEWLSGFVFYALYSYGGETALLLFRSTIYLLTIVVVIRTLLLLSPASPTTAAWFLLCMYHGSFGWAGTVRCQVFTYFFIPLVVLGILNAHLKNRWSLLFFAPLFMIPWCNLHGGFVLGIILTLGFSCFLLITRGKWMRPLFISTLMIAATTLNPYGFTSYWKYLVDALTMSRPTIPEWAPLWEQPDQCAATLLFTVVILSGVILTLRKRTGPSLKDFTLPSKETILLLSGLIVFSAYSAFRHARMLVFYMVLLAPLGSPFIVVAAGKCAYLFPSFSKKLRRVWSFTLPSLAICTLCIVLTQRPERLLSLNYNSFPTQAIAQLSTSPREGRLLASFNVGSYALWKLYPKFLISVDGRYETVYPDSTVERVEEAITSGELSKVDELNPTDILIVKNKNTPTILTNLSEKWVVWYEDSKAVLLKPR